MFQEQQKRAKHRAFWAANNQGLAISKCAAYALANRTRLILMARPDLIPGLKSRTNSICGDVFQTTAVVPLLTKQNLFFVQTGLAINLGPCHNATVLAGREVLLNRGNHERIRDMGMDVKTVGACHRALLIALAIQGFTPDLHDLSSAMLPWMFPDATSGAMTEDGPVPLPHTSIGHDPSDACTPSPAISRPRMRFNFHIQPGLELVAVRLFEELFPSLCPFLSVHPMAGRGGLDLNRSLCRLLC